MNKKITIFIVTLLVMVTLSSTPIVQAQTHTDYVGGLNFNGDWGNTAAQIENYASGSGTEQDPYIFEWMRFILDGSAIGICLINISYVIEVRNCIFQASTRIEGIWADRMVNLDIINCTFSGAGLDITNDYNTDIYYCGFSGVRVSFQYAEGTSFYNNTLIGSSTDMFFSNSSHMYIAHNLFQDCATGMVFVHGFIYSLLEYNTLINCMTGAQISVAMHNIIQYNWIENCTSYGIIIDSGSYNNTLYANTIIGSGIVQPSVALAADEGSGLVIVGDSVGNNIIWNTFGENSQSAKDDSGNDYMANYWSEYDGVDDNSDGFGDTNHIIPGESNSYDILPRMSKDLSLYNIEEPTTTVTTTTTTTDIFNPLPILVIAGLSVVSIVAIVFVLRKRGN